MEFIGELADVTKDIVHGGYRITFSCADVPNSVNECTGTKLRVVAKKNRNKRSLDANAYCWLLISNIADIVGGDKELIYQECLRKYGQPLVDNGHVQMMSVVAEADVNSYGIYTKYAGNGWVHGKEFAHYIILRGSSTYDTKEMSIFIDGIVEDAKELGIDTVPIVELDKIKEKWHL